VYSLFKISYFNPVIIILSVFVWLLFPGLSTFSYIAIFVSIHQIVLLFNSIGHVIPVRYLFGCFMCLQYFIGPVLAYNGLDQFQYPLYRMQIGETQYFQYAVPAVLLFILGLHIRAGNLKGEHIDLDKITAFVSRHKKLPYIFIAIGLVSSMTVLMLPQSLTFVMLAISSLKFVGVFLLVLGSKHLKPLPLIIVFGSIISSSLGNAMFHDLLIWVIFTGCVLCTKYKPNLAVKLALCVGFILLAVVIQQVKFTLRGALREGKQGNLQLLTNAYYQEQQSKGLFTFQSLAPNNVRINQGFIITYIMKNVPSVTPFSEGGELYQIIEAAFLPRFLAPNKLEAGDRTIFTRYTGIPLDYGTSMGLSSLGDAYINFGIFGGCIFMLILGLFYSEVLIGFGKHAVSFPVLALFTPVVFLFPIRPDSELQMSLGHIVKTTFLVYVFFRFYKEMFRYNEVTSDEEGELLTPPEIAFSK
jgi:hypothetical protein